MAMGNKVFMAAITTSVILVSLLAGMQVVNVAKANPYGFRTPNPDLPPIYIRDNGDVEPSNASIRRVGETYTFTGNITGYSIIVQKSNITIDGAGNTLQGLPNRSAYIMHGIVLNGVTNITVKNALFKGLDIGVYFTNPSGNCPAFNNLITQNVFIDCAYGCNVGYQCFSNTFSRNTFTETAQGWMIYGIYLCSSNNFIVENDFKNIHSSAASINGFAEGSHSLGCGALGFDGYSDTLYGSSYNTITANTFENNTRTVELIGNSKGNSFYQNNFVGSSVILMLPYPPPFNSNSWNSTSQGNYWSDYNETDLDGDGVGDTPYVIDGNNTDYHPLMSPTTDHVMLSSPPTGTPTPIQSIATSPPSSFISDPSTYQPTIEPAPSTSVPELPIWAILPLFTLATLTAFICNRKRKQDGRTY
jgi:nitrous oxidase accessory protein NosD